MLIRENDWEKIREKFSENEKIKLRKCVVGQAICPKGFIVDLDLLEDLDLKHKLVTLLK